MDLTGGPEGDMRSRGALAVIFKMTKCTSHLGIGLGEGVQPAVMALMAGKRAFERLPDCAIFADTRWEPPSVYEHLEWLKDGLSFPLHAVDNGRSDREDVKAFTNHSGSRHYVDILVYLKGSDRQGDGIGRRQCTDNYKRSKARMRDGLAFAKEPYLHSLRTPLAEAVALDEVQ